MERRVVAKMDFNRYPSYDRYRTLRLTEPQMRGYDVFALQTALKANGFDPQGLDGILGNNSATAIKACQFKYELVVDGWAGGKTQEALGRKLAEAATSKYHIAGGAMRGQLEHESSWRLGNYSEQRPDTSYDAGIAQMNSAHYDPAVGFDCLQAVNTLAKNTSDFFVVFIGVKDMVRRWTLAQGAWNAPAYACYMAKEEGATMVLTRQTAKPGVTARMQLEDYMASVSTYLSL